MTPEPPSRSESGGRVHGKCPKGHYGIAGLPGPPREATCGVCGQTFQLVRTA